MRGRIRQDPKPVALSLDRPVYRTTIAALIGHSRGSVTSRYIHTVGTALIVGRTASPATFTAYWMAWPSGTPPMRSIETPGSRRFERPHSITS